MKKIILTESGLHALIKESVRNILKEMDNNQESDYNGNIGKQFIDFIEKYKGGVLLQTVVDCESGQQIGYPCSPLPTIIPEFEDCFEIKCTPEMKKAIKAAYNQWWHYAQNELLGDEDKDFVDDFYSHSN